MSYYIYHIPGKKIGCTTQYPKRCIDQGFHNYELLETHEDGWLAGDRELQLQKEYGYDIDNSHYMISRNNRPTWSDVIDSCIASRKRNNTNGIGAKAALKKGTHNTMKKVKCHHCQKEGSQVAMKRWHFDNCKYKNEE